jgi:hypothetical protein
MNYERASGEFSGVAKLLSPKFGQSGPYCELKFNYYKDDTEVSLGLYYQSPVSATSSKLWSARDSTTQMNSWEEMVVGINGRPAGFKLYFEAVLVSSDLNSLLAIDDVSLVNCQPAPKTECSQPDAFRCQNGFCIVNSLVRIQTIFGSHAKCIESRARCFELSVSNL